MFRKLAAIRFPAIGFSALIVLAAAGQVEGAEKGDAGSRAVSRDLKAALNTGEMPAPVTSVTRFRRLPDGTVVRQCDVVTVKAGRGLEQRPRGEWIEVPARKQQ